MNTQPLVKNDNGALLEKVILGNDLSGLNSTEKVSYVKNICDSLGLNPMTRPIQLIKFQGKEIPYFSKDATEQLRKLNNISLSITETKIVDDIYIVVVEARTNEGRSDSATGAVVIGKLQGEAKANAFMKAETKAKRRATLSICGLGFIDECEAESIPGAMKVTPINETPLMVNEASDHLDNDINYIKNSNSIDELQTRYSAIVKMWQKRKDMEAVRLIILAKDKRKEELNVIEFKAELKEAEFVNLQTGVLVNE